MNSLQQRHHTSKGRIRSSPSSSSAASTGNSSSSKRRLALVLVLLSALCVPQSCWCFQQLHPPAPSQPQLQSRVSFSTALPFSVGAKGNHAPSLQQPYQQSSSQKRSNHYFALDYRDAPPSCKRRNIHSSPTCLSLSSVALPSSSSSLVNDGSDYYSWISSGWGNAVSRPIENAYNPPTSSRQQQQQQQQQHRFKSNAYNHLLQHSEEYKRRKEEWAKRYTSLNGLREAFGSNKNKLWGDFDAATTRKLYKTLLPNALCELVLELGVEPEELAPLAYKARKAAKLYARERCHVPARLAANLFDGFRQWRRYGRFQPGGMSYEQVWDKYYHQQLEQVSHHEDDVDHSVLSSSHEDSLDWDDSVTEEEIISQTCQKILEKSCTTNEMIDRMVLGKKHPNRDNHNVRKHRNELLLKRISNTLERDVRKLLDPTLFRDEDKAEESSSSDQHAKRGSARALTPQQYHALKMLAMARKQSARKPTAAAR